MSYKETGSFKSPSQLKLLQKTEIRSVARSELYDISDLKITENPVSERLEKYIKKVKNPYCIRVKNVPVKLVFTDGINAPTVENLLVNIAKDKFL